ncbi:hypothetical protein [Vannielia sp.]|uniref:hypothetical protein n=1 Tax=Vannielia sp. TaxID=2813045 RepID=UPI002638BED3|nr:hypothetical protein [Vannielia sp.]MDF1871340.1 hypothetical protein [Vannielia sp.]
MSDGKPDGQFTPGPVDPVSGQRWVYVTPQMVGKHPQGRLNLALYGVILFFVAMAAWRFVLWAYGFSGVWFGLEIIIFGLAAVALFFRVAPAAWLGIASCAMMLIDFATGLKLVWGVQIWAIAEVIAALVVGFYLLTGARPNLIYRHRYLMEGGDVS